MGNTFTTSSEPSSEQQQSCEQQTENHPTNKYIDYNISSRISWDDDNSDNPNVDIYCVLELSSGSKFKNHFNSVKEFNEFNDGINQIVDDRKLALFSSNNSNNSNNNNDYNPYRNIPIYLGVILRNFTSDIRQNFIE